MKLTNFKYCNGDIIKMLVKHFNYSIADINSYDELTDKEKEIIPREFFDKFVE